MLELISQAQKTAKALKIGEPHELIIKEGQQIQLSWRLASGVLTVRGTEKQKVELFFQKFQVDRSLFRMPPVSLEDAGWYAAELERYAAEFPRIIVGETPTYTFGTDIPR
jgi:hypothetical protein